MNDRTNDLSIKAAEGTCMWLLRHEVCANWSTKDRALLWIKGKPGSGKSTLLRWFLDERRRQNSETGNKSLILSFFFHGRGLDLEKTPLGLFRSLLHQMLSQVPEAAPDLIQIFQQRCDTMGKPGEEWHWHLRELQEALHSAISNVLERRNVWLFVDALDECGKPDAIELVRHFEHLLASTPPRNFQFSICVTCRHYPALDLGSAYEIALESENDGDISAYVRDRLSFLDATSASRIIDVISKRADGIFMWASLQIHRVLELELEGASLAKIEAEIRSTPRGLYSIYHGLVQNMIERSKSLKLLQWICFATRPLTLEELSWVLVVDADHTSPIKSLEQARNSDDYIANSVKMELQLKSLSCGLVEVVGSSGSQVAQFIHQSVRDYFVETGISALDNSLDASENNSNCVIGMAHHQISRTCIRYITMNEIVQSTARREALNARFPLLQYAVRFWTEHAKKSEQNGVTQEDLLLYFDWPSPKLLQAWRRVLDQTYNPLSGSPPAWTSMLHMLSENHLITPLRTILSPANQENIDINERDSHGQTALFSAVSSGNVAVVRLLLGSDGIDINARDSYGQTALLGAVSRRHVAVVELPLDTDGTTMNAGDSQGQTTLLGAALYRHLAVVKLLLGADDIDINARDSHGQTALLGAALNGHAAVVQLLLGADDIDINARNSHGQTALLGAALNGHVVIVELLLDMKDVKINARNQQNLTPLLIAARHNYQSIVELLLATNQAHTNANDDFGRTPLSYAAETGHVAAIKIYVTDEENIHLRDAKGRAPLWYAARAGEVQAAEILIQKGADIAAASTSGAAGLLCVAASHGQTGIIKLLLENQAEVGAATDDGTTPLHAASSHGQPQAIRLLIENQAEVGAKDIYGQTSLHLAVMACHFVSTKILFEAGADIHVANKAGETPRQLALRGGDLATLLNAGPWIWPRQDRLLHLRKLRKLVFAISFEFQL